MRIISLIILISFLLTNTAYPSSTLRVPVGKIDPERSNEVGTYTMLFKSSFGPAGVAEKAIKERFRIGFSKEKRKVAWGERKEALQLLDDLKEVLSVNKMRTLSSLGLGVPTAAEKAGSIYEFRRFMELAIKLAENEIDPGPMLQTAIPEVARIARNDMHKLEIFIDLGMKLSENKIDPVPTMRYAIRAVDELAEDINELKDLCNYLLELNISFEERKIDSGFTLLHGIFAVSKVAKKMDEEKVSAFKDGCNNLFEMESRFEEARKRGNRRKKFSIMIDSSFLKLERKGVGILHTVARLAENMDGFKEASNYLLGLDLKSIDGQAKLELPALKHVVSIASEAAKNIHELEGYIGLGRGLIGQGIYSKSDLPTLQYTILAAARLVDRRIGGLEEICEYLLEFNSGFQGDERDRNFILQYGIVYAANLEPTKDMDSLNKYVGLAIKLTENGENPISRLLSGAGVEETNDELTPNNRFYFYLALITKKVLTRDKAASYIEGRIEKGRKGKITEDKNVLILTPTITEDSLTLEIAEHPASEIDVSAYNIHELRLGGKGIYTAKQGFQEFGHVLIPSAIGTGGMAYQGEIELALINIDGNPIEEIKEPSGINDVTSALSSLTNL